MTARYGGPFSTFKETALFVLAGIVQLLLVFRWALSGPFDSDAYGVKRRSVPCP
jgi:hypothetical protein